MLTSYDQYTAGIFDEAGIAVLLVGDSAANNVFGHETTLPITVDELLPLVRAVVRATKRTLVVGDMPFGSYEEGPDAGAAHRRAVHEGGRLPRGQARGRARLCPTDRRDDSGGHPGDGTRRLHPAAGAHARWLPGAGARGGR